LLGVAVQEVNQALADAFRLPRPTGGLVYDVAPGGPGASAGLLPGDVILEVDKRPILASGELPALFAVSPPGRKVEITVWRNGQTLQLAATLGDSSKTARETAPVAPAVPAQGQLGMALRPLDAGERHLFGIAAGLVVESASGPSKDAGVSAGDVILAINGKAASSVEELRKAVAGSGKVVALLVLREGDKSFIPVRLP
jgi:serine protease Do